MLRVSAHVRTSKIKVLGRPFVKRFALSYRTVVYLSCPVLSVTLVYCGQMVGRIKMKLGTQVGLGPGHIVLDGDPGLPLQRGTAPPIFGPHLLWPNGIWRSYEQEYSGTFLTYNGHRCGFLC